MNAVLAIETSVPQASVELRVDGEVIFSDEFTTDRNHNSMLFNPLEQALKLLGDEKLSLVIAGTGPGSYSGTRVGIAAAQGVAIAHGCPAVGVGSLGAIPEINAQPLEGEGGTPALAIGDARRGLYYISVIAPSGEAMEAELMDADAFQKRLTEEPLARLFTLDDPAKLALGEGLAERVVRTRPEAKWLLALWDRLDDARREALIAKPLAPAYLRPPFTSKAKGGHPLLRKNG